MSSLPPLSEQEHHPYDLTLAECYDLETYPNLFTYTGLEVSSRKTRTFEISERKNQLFGLVQHLRTKPLLVGFNSAQYDNTLLHYILSQYTILAKLSAQAICHKLYQLSNAIIHFDKQNEEVKKAVGKLRFQEHFPWLDMLEVIREGYSIKGLKAVGVNLKWPRIQDLPYPFNHQVQPEEIAQILDYNLNDVLVTEAVLKEVTPRLHMRAGFSQKYNVHCYSDADSRIAKTTLNKFYSEFSGQPIESFQRLRTKRNNLPIRQLIFPWVKFTTPELNDYLQQLKTLTITNIDEQATCAIPALHYAGVEYTLALGGIHSVDKPGIFLSDEHTLLWDMDVASQYPRCILANRVCPAHLKPEHFLGTLDFMVKERLQFKKLGKTDPSAKVAEAGLKISINTAYGLFNSKSYWLYDPKCTYQVTINNQLSLLMLVERLVSQSIEVLSANTDGLIIRCRPDQKQLVKDIQQQWQQDTGFELEDTFYTKYIRRDINNYITLKEDGEAKVKGIFIPQGGILKGYDKPIVAIALRNYFLSDIPVEQTITQIGTPYIFSNLTTKGDQRVTDIYDYCMAQKCGSSYSGVEMEQDGITKPLQRSVRYYASNTGGTIYKIKEKDGVVSRQTLLASSPVTLFNDYVEGPYDINYQYYIDEVKKLICLIEGKEWINRDKIAAKLEKLEARRTKLQPLYDNYVEKGKTHLKVFASTEESLKKVLEEIALLSEKL